MHSFITPLLHYSKHPHTFLTKQTLTNNILIIFCDKIKLNRQCKFPSVSNYNIWFSFSDQLKSFWKTLQNIIPQIRQGSSKQINYSVIKAKSRKGRSIYYIFECRRIIYVYVYKKSHRCRKKKLPHDKDFLILCVVYSCVLVPALLVVVFFLFILLGGSFVYPICECLPYSIHRTK